MTEFLFQATIYLAAAVLAVPISRRLGLGSVLGFMIAGVVIGQVGNLIGFGQANLMEYAELGVVMLLFLIGLELEPRVLWEKRGELVGLGGLQICITTCVIAVFAKLLGLTWLAGIAVGMALALSSTAMVLQTLSEKRLTQTDGGRAALSVLLTQDVAVIPMLVIIPLLSNSGSREVAVVNDSASVHGEDGMGVAFALIEQLPAWGVAGVMLASIALVVVVGQFLVRPFFRYITQAGLIELSTAATLLLVAGTALLMSLVGLSPALGTFLAGVVLANSEFRHQMESHIEPFKGLFLGLFFMLVGAGINFSILFSNLLAVIGITIGLILVKFAVLLPLAGMFSIRGRDQWLVALSLAQAGEFGFVLLTFMLQTDVIDHQLSETLLLVVAISMALTPLLFKGYDHLARKILTPGDRWPAEEVGAEGPIIIAGVGRFGKTVHDMVQGSGYRTTLLDSDVHAIKMLRKSGYKVFLGDPMRPEMLEAAGLDDSRILVVAIDTPDQASVIVRYARRRRPDLCIIARAKDRESYYRLYHAGATHVVRETFHSSVRAGQYVLESMGIPVDEAELRAHTFQRYERNKIRELAAVWDPNTPIEQNLAYNQRRRELNQEFETGLGIQQELTPDIDDEAFYSDSTDARVDSQQGPAIGKLQAKDVFRTWKSRVESLQKAAAQSLTRRPGRESKFRLSVEEWISSKVVHRRKRAQKPE